MQSGESTGERSERAQQAVGESSQPPPVLARDDIVIAEPGPSPVGDGPLDPKKVVLAYAGIISLGLAAVISAELPPSLLLFVVVPVLGAPVYLPPWAYVSMSLIATIGVGVASLELDDRPFFFYTQREPDIETFGFITLILHPESRFHVSLKIIRGVSTVVIKGFFRYTDDNEDFFTEHSHIGLETTAFD